MGWFERFATQGLIYPAFLVAFGWLIVLRTPSARMLEPEELTTLPPLVRPFVKWNSPRLQRGCGWIMIALAVGIAAVRMLRG